MDFPEYFHENIYSHMFLIERKAHEKYMLIPPNQMDWCFTLDRISPDKWLVHASRGETGEEYVEVYARDTTDNTWVSIDCRYV